MYFDPTPRYVNQPVENWLPINTCNSTLAYITLCTTKLINTAARRVRAHLDFCTSWVEHSNFCYFKGVTYMSPLQCMIH